jgi:hypothetical protein
MIIGCKQESRKERFDVGTDPSLESIDSLIVFPDVCYSILMSLIDCSTRISSTNILIFIITLGYSLLPPIESNQIDWKRIQGGGKPSEKGKEQNSFDLDLTN